MPLLRWSHQHQQGKGKGGGAEERSKTGHVPVKVADDNTSLNKKQGHHGSPQSTVHSTGLSWLHVYALLLSLTVACYSINFNGAWVYDDKVQKGSLDVTGVTPWWKLFQHDFWGKPLDGAWSHKSYRPITVLALRWTYAFSGQDTWLYHVTDAILHSLNAFLITLMCHMLGSTRQVAITVGVIFSVHPIHVDSVANISGRSETLSGFFAVLAFLLVMRARQSSSNRNINSKSQRNDNDNDNDHGSSAEGDRKDGDGQTNTVGTGSLGLCSMVASVLLCWLSALSKEQGAMSFLIVAIPDIIAIVTQLLPILLEQCSSKTSNRASTNTSLVAEVMAMLKGPPVARVALFGISGAIFTAFRLWMTGGSEITFYKELINPICIMETPKRLLNAFHVWLYYVDLHVYQTTFSPSYTKFPLIADWSELPFLKVSVYLTTVATYLLLWLPRQSGKRLVFHITALVWSVTTYFPASHLLLDVGFVVAERVMYQPSIGNTMVVADLACSFVDAWSNVIATVARSFTGVRRAIHLEEEEEVEDEHNKNTSAQFQVRSHLRWFSILFVTSAYAVQCIRGAATFNDEITIFENCAKQFPMDTICTYGVAHALSWKGELSRAAQWVEHTVQHDPHFNRGHWLLGLLKKEMGDTDAADKAFSKMDLNFFGGTEYGMFLFGLGRQEEAVERILHATRSGEMSPGSPQYCSVWNNAMCIAYIVNREEENTRIAAAELQKGCLTTVTALENTVAVRAMLGETQEAMRLIHEFRAASGEVSMSQWMVETEKRLVGGEPIKPFSINCSLYPSFEVNTSPETVPVAQ